MVVGVYKKNLVGSTQGLKSHQLRYKPAHLLAQVSASNCTRPTVKVSGYTKTSYKTNSADSQHHKGLHPTQRTPMDPTSSQLGHDRFRNMNPLPTEKGHWEEKYIGQNQNK